MTRLADLGLLEPGRGHAMSRSRSECRAQLTVRARGTDGLDPRARTLALGKPGIEAPRIQRPDVVTGVPFLWLLFFFLVPFLIVLKISVSQMQMAMPPYEPFVTWTSAQVMELKVNFANYAFLWEDALYRNAYLNSIHTAAVSTVLCLLIGYPMAYGIARSRPAGAISCCCWSCCRSGRRFCSVSTRGSAS